MKKSLYNICILLLVWIASGCYDDRGNYDYKDINEFAISGFNGSVSDFFTYSLEDEIYIVPDIVFADSKELELLYEWYGDDSLISTEGELRYLAKDLKNVRHKETRSFVKLKVTDKQSGYIQLRGFNVDVTPPYCYGYVALTEDANGECEMTFLRNVWQGDELAEVKVEMDAYAQQNPGEKLGKGIERLRHHFCYDYALPDNIIAVKRTEPYNLDIFGDFLEKNVYTAKYFLNEELPENYAPIDEFCLCNYTYILNADGKLYSRKKNNDQDFQSGVYLNTPNELYSPSELPKDMEITRVFISYFNSNVFAFLYDAKYQRLLVASNDGRVLYPFALTAQDEFPEAFPRLHDLKGEVLYMGRTKASLKTDWVMVFKDESGDVKLFKMYVGLQLYNGNIIDATLNNPVIYSSITSYYNEKSLFEQPNRGGEVMFFTGGDDNKVLYAYDFSTQGVSEYVRFDESINSLACEEYYREGVGTENRTLSVGLASGEVKIIDIRYEAQHESNKDKRVLASVSLEGRKIKHLIYKVGFLSYAQ